MSEIETKLKEENEFIKELFNFNGNEAQLKNLKEMITNKQNSPNYFIQLLEYYSKCRPNHHNVSRELTECIYSCFQEQINEIQQYIRKTTKIFKIPYMLKFIMFPEEFPINENKEQQEMFSLLQIDDVD